MSSVIRNTVEERIARIYDTNLGAQGAPKEIKAAVAKLKRSIGEKPKAGSAKDLMRDLAKTKGKRK